jgi:hypothetical protein
MDGKALFTGMMRLYAAIHRELEDSLLPVCAKKREEDVPRSKRRKRNSDSDDSSSTSKRDVTDKFRPLPVYQKPRPVATKNFFAPLRAVSMEGTEASDEGKSSGNIDKGRPPPIVLPSEANLSLQKDLKTVVTGGVLLPEYYIRYPNHNKKKYGRLQSHAEPAKSEKSSIIYILHQGRQTSKTVIRHLPSNTSSESITVSLQELGYDVISVKQMTVKAPLRQEVTLLYSFPSSSSPC